MTTQITVRVEQIDRLRNSLNGNPRWQITSTAESGLQASLPTAPDIMDAYAVCEPMVGKTVTLTLDLVNGRSQIVGITWEGR